MLDHTDKKIVEALQKNGRITMKELGEKVHLTGQAAASRVVKLEEAGVINGYTIQLNHQKLGYPVHSFINIFIKGIDHHPYLSFLEAQKEYIIHNYKISGESCYLLECRFPSTDELDLFLMKLNKYVNYQLSIVIKETTKKDIY
ncbi:MAG: Lrp/AsnC family transcriptional regulator [Bacillus sp. (in: firmicutes)]